MDNMSEVSRSVKGSEVKLVNTEHIFVRVYYKASLKKYQSGIFWRENESSVVLQNDSDRDRKGHVCVYDCVFACECLYVCMYLRVLVIVSVCLCGSISSMFIKQLFCQYIYT